MCRRDEKVSQRDILCITDCDHFKPSQFLRTVFDHFYIKDFKSFFITKNLTCTKYRTTMTSIVNINLTHTLLHITNPLHDLDKFTLAYYAHFFARPRMKKLLFT